RPDPHVVLHPARPSRRRLDLDERPVRLRRRLVSDEPMIERIARAWGDDGIPNVTPRSRETIEVSDQDLPEKGPYPGRLFDAGLAPRDPRRVWALRLGPEPALGANRSPRSARRLRQGPRSTLCCSGETEPVSRGSSGRRVRRSDVAR